MLAGQLSFSLAEEVSLTGRLVVDEILAPPDEVGLVANPVILDTNGGRLTRIDCGREAVALKRWLASHGDPDLRLVAHISPGFNSGITASRGRILEDERVFGDVDFGFGAWIDCDPAVHFELTCQQVSLCCDGRALIQVGCFTDPEICAIYRERGVPAHAPEP